MVRGQRHAPAASYPRERPCTHCTGGWVGPRSGLDRCGKSRSLPGFDPRTVQPVGSRYTGWATRPTTRVCGTSKIQDERSLYNDLKIARYVPDIKRDSYVKCLHRRAIPACISLSVADCTALTAPSSIAAELMTFPCLDFTTHLLNRWTFLSGILWLRDC